MSNMFPNHRNNGSSGESAANQALSIVTIALDRDTQSLMKLWLPSATIREIPNYPDDDAFLESMGSPDVCIIDFDRLPSKAFTVAERIHQESAEIAIFVVSSDARPDVIIQAMRCGCREYLFKPLVREQVLEAIVRGSRRRERKERSSAAQVLTFVGAKGGCGVTTIATQLGTMLASTGKKTLLMDLHPSLGDAALYLGFTTARYHSYELIENTDRLDAELLQNLILHHASGLAIVPAPSDFESTRHLGSGTIAQTFGVLRQMYDFILIDVPPGLNEQSTKLIALSEFIYVVTVAEVAALRNVSQILDYTTQEEVQDEKVRVILNRYDKRSAIPDSQIEKVIRRKIFWAVPNQYYQAVKVITDGDSGGNNSRSELLRSMKEWADRIVTTNVDTVPRTTPTTTKKKRGLLGLFGEN